MNNKIPIDKNERRIDKAESLATIGAVILFFTAFFIAIFQLTGSFGDTPLSSVAFVVLIICAFLSIYVLNRLADKYELPLWLMILAFLIFFVSVPITIDYIASLLKSNNASSVITDIIVISIPNIGLLLIAIGSLLFQFVDYSDLPPKPNVSTDDNNTLTLSPELSKLLINQLVNPNEDVKEKRDAFLDSITKINPSENCNTLSFTINSENNELFQDLLNAIKEEKEQS